ncbi:hypothetical protein [Paraburkholderia lacunae]
MLHARGRIAIIDDKRYARSVIDRLTRAHKASQP